MNGSLSGFDLVGCFITLAKLFVLKKQWQTAADFTMASLTLTFHRMGLSPDSLKNDAFEHPEQPIHPDVLRFLSDHSCLVHILAMIDRGAEILPYLPMLEKIVKLNMLQMHHADAVPPFVVFHAAASEVYRAANMPTRSAASMKNAIDLLQVDPGIQRRLMHAPTSHTGNLSFDSRVMARLLQSQTVLAARMKQRDEKEGRMTDPLPYRPPRVPLPVPEFELPSYGPGSACDSCPKPFIYPPTFCLNRLSAQARPLRPLPGHHAHAEEARSGRQRDNGPLGCTRQGAQSFECGGCSREHRAEPFSDTAHAGRADFCSRFVGARKGRTVRRSNSVLVVFHWYLDSHRVCVKCYESCGCAAVKAWQHLCLLWPKNRFFTTAASARGSIAALHAAHGFDGPYYGGPKTKHKNK